jgi:predicted ATPase
VIRQAHLYVQPGEDDLALFQPMALDSVRSLNRYASTTVRRDSQTKQRQLSQAVKRLLDGLGRPVMIILEDLQWAGSESMALLQDLVPSVDDLPVLMAGTVRDDGPNSLREQLKAAKYMQLNRLNSADIAKLSESMLGRAGRDPVVIELLQRETEGNAFFLVETVRALAEEAGRLDRINVTRPPQFIMPRGIQAILVRRLSRVPKDARPLMQLASVAGRVLDLALLREMEPEADFETWLITCTNVSVLEAYGDTWRFSHDKLREAIKDSLSHELHHTLHRRVAEAMESLYAERAEFAAALAHHWLVAGDREKELYYTTVAAEQAINSNASEEATALLERISELHQILSEPAAGDSHSDAH